MDEFGLRVLDGLGGETLNINSFSMRTVINIRKDKLNPAGETVDLIGFDPTKGVAFLTVYGQQVGWVPNYRVTGSFPNAKMVFIDSQQTPPTIQTILITTVHYR